jgi:hypothetical protein
MRHSLTRLQPFAALFALGLLALVGAADSAPSSSQAPAGFRPLFNGKDLAGWKIPEGDGGHWKVVDGVIDYDAQSQAKGDKNLWTDRPYGDFILRVDWRIKETPYTNPNVFYVLPDGTHGRDVKGKELHLALPDSDSGVMVRGDVKNQFNIWCWPIGSGEMYGYRTDAKMPAEVKAAVTPRTQADKPVGQWNTFEITCRGDEVTCVLNGKTVIEKAKLPGLAATGPNGLQHHGSMRDGKWTSPPALLQFRNIYITELGGQAGASAADRATK